MQVLLCNIFKDCQVLLRKGFPFFQPAKSLLLDIVLKSKDDLNLELMYWYTPLCSIGLLHGAFLKIDKKMKLTKDTFL